MGHAQGRRPDSDRRLVDNRGKWEPELSRIKRMVKHWQSEVAGSAVPGVYWGSLAGTAGKHMGALDIEGRRVQVAGTQGLALQVAGAARAALWRAHAKRRMHLPGLEQGRDEAAMTALLKELTSPKHAGMIGGDSVYTPAKGACVRRQIGCTMSTLAHAHRGRRMHSGCRVASGIQAM